VPQERSDEQALTELVDERYLGFLKTCGLHELGVNHNQILDELRADDELSERLRSFGTRVKQQLGNLHDGVDARTLTHRISEHLREHWTKVTSQVRARRDENAAEWVDLVQDRVLAQGTDAAARHGLRGPAALLARAASELADQVKPELREEARRWGQEVETTAQRVSGRLTRFSGQITGDNPIVQEAIDEAKGGLEAGTERELRLLTAELAADLATGFLKPLSDQLFEAANKLEAACQSTVARSSPFESWVDDEVPERLRPSEIEVRLEDADSYPALFADLIDRTVGTRGASSGHNGKALSEILLGSGEGNRASALLDVRQRWTPSQQILESASATQSLKADVVDDLDRVTERVQAWCYRLDTVLGAELTASLTDWLDDRSVDAAEHDRRVARLRDGVREAIALSKPLITLETGALVRVHGTSELGETLLHTPIPVSASHDAREPVEGVLRDAGIPEHQIAEHFGDAGGSTVEFSTFLESPVHLPVMGSLTVPIAEDWNRQRHQPGQGEIWRLRRTRPLRHFVTAEGTQVRDVLRGWFVGRALGQVTASDPFADPIEVALPDDGAAALPNPLLGTGRDDRPIDVAPAVLESLAITLVEHGASGSDRLVPYWRLADLGRARADDTGGMPLPRALHDWICKGVVESGMPDPPVETAGPNGGENPEKRLEVVQETVERYREATERQTSAQPDLRKLRGRPRAWELAPELTGVLDELLRGCELLEERLADADKGPVW
jgi:hypothetical protein